MLQELHYIKAQQSEALTKAKTKFIANISHELRTPLHGIVRHFIFRKIDILQIGMTTFLRETKLTPEQTEYIDIVQSSAEALVSLTNDILDSARIEQKGEDTLVRSRNNLTHIYIATIYIYKHRKYICVYNLAYICFYKPRKYICVYMYTTSHIYSIYNLASYIHCIYNVAQ